MLLFVTKVFSLADSQGTLVSSKMTSGDASSMSIEAASVTVCFERVLDLLDYSRHLGSILENITAKLL